MVAPARVRDHVRVPKGHCHRCARHRHGHVPAAVGCRDHVPGQSYTINKLATDVAQGASYERSWWRFVISRQVHETFVAKPDLPVQ